MKIAIDGPAGAGKSTIARRVASALGYLYIDTGAMYRALTAEILRRGIDPRNRADVTAVAHAVPVHLRRSSQGAALRVYVDDRDVTDQIRSPEVSRSVSAVASHPGVRRAMVAQQQSMAQRGCVVMDGRDIGTCVMPDADIKVFLRASVKERARRRSLELLRAGHAVDLDALEDEIRQRDLTDSTRAASPLRKAPDALEIDTTTLTIDEVVETVLLLCRSKEERHV